MSKNWDTVSNSAHATPHGWENNRCIEYSAGIVLYCRIYIDAANDLWYSFGEDASWIDQQLTGAAGILGNNVAVGNASIALDRDANQAHIAYVDTTNMQINFCHLHVLNAPAVAANWHGWAGVKFTRVDNGASDKHCVSVCDDGSTNNGNNEPHVIWDDDAGAGNWRIRMASSGGGPNHNFGAPIVLANTPGEQHPTIICTEDEGRELYAFWVSADSQDIECMKCPDASNPAIVGNWGGPAAGAGAGPDVAITGQVGDVATPPSASWWWDADERVIVSTALVGTTDLPVTNYWDETAGPAAWAGQLGASSPNFGVPVGVMIVNRANSNKWTMYAHDNAGQLEYSIKDSSYSFAGVTWYDEGRVQEAPANNSYMSCEWRHLESISADHSVVVWVDGGNDLWYGETRINTVSASTIVGPTGSTYHNELNTIEFDWTFNDAEGDTQRQYYAQIDDDIGFGSPIADPGTNFRLNTWVATGAGGTDDDQTLNAGVLAANKTYYWRVKIKDSEYGTVYDPANVTAAYSASGTFKTTPPFTMNIVSATQQADKSSAIDFTLTLPSGVDWNDDVEITAYEYDDNGGYGAFTLDSNYYAPPGELLASIVITEGTKYFTIGWDAHADVEPPTDTYDDATIDIRLTARYTGDAHGLGNVTNIQASVALDFKSPDSVTLGVPEGDNISVQKPTLNVSASDTNGWESDFTVYHDAGYTVVLETSGYQGLGTTSYKMTTDFTRAGTWYWEVTTRDGSASQNEDPAPTQGSFTYSPPPTPTECFDGAWSLEIEPNREWDGDEFDLVIKDDLMGSVVLTEGHNSPNRLDFILNNARGKYLDPSSATYIPKGSEVRLEKGDKRFYGIVKTIGGETMDNRTVSIYCESFISFAESMPIQVRVVPTASSGLYWEDYIKKGLAASGLIPKWFRLVDSSGSEIFAGDSDNMTPVQTGSEILYDKVSPVEFLNDAAARTGKVWYEGGIPEVGRRTLLYWTSPPNTNDATADHTFYIESDVLYEALEHDFDSLINRVIFTDANVMEQDMDSIREYGIFVLYQKSRGVEDKERLVEIAQYILEERSQPVASGRIKLFDEVSVTPNQVVKIYEESTYDVKSGFTGKYVVTGVVTKIAEATTTEISVTNRWENPFIRELLEVLKDTTRSDEPLVILRGETAEVRVDCITNGVDLSSEATYTDARLGMDRYSDEDTDADYYSTYGWN